MSYGVVPQGFSPKPLSVTLDELQTKMVEVFGPQIVQSSQSPAGQINGLFADLATTLHLFAQDMYQTYDPDQAEGRSLDRLGRIRLLTRTLNETDVSFRQAITNAGRARIDIQDLARAVLGVSGVTYAHIFINDSGSINEHGMTSPSIAVAVLGGDDDEIATVVREYVVPGMPTHGNVRIDTTIQGFCRSIFLLRPILVPVTLDMTVRAAPDINGCPPPSPATIVAAIVNNVHLLNGEDITLHRLRSALAALYGNTVELLEASVGLDLNTLAPAPFAVAFTEMATLSADAVTIRAV